MPQFKYTVSQKGKEATGIVEAENITEAGEKLQEQGGYILELKERFFLGEFKLSRWLQKVMSPLMMRMDVMEKILFTSQLGSMLKTGLPVTKAIEAFVDEKQTRTSALLKQVLDQLKSGKSLSETLAGYPQTFDKVYVNVLRSGETMGKMAESLIYLGKQMKKEHGLKTKVKSAMTYPIVVLMAMAGVMSFIAISVVPKIVIFAKNAGAQLPQVTQAIIRLTEIMSDYWWLIILIFISVGGGGIRVLKTPEGRKLADRLLLKLPIIGELVRRYNQARFARLLSGFYRYGISVKEGFEILTDTLSNYYYSQACIRMGEKIMAGKSLSASLSSE